MNADNAPTIIGTIIFIAQTIAFITIPAYRAFCIDMALWGWNLAF